MIRQLALNLRLRESASFDNFCVGGNQEAFERLQRLLADPPAVSGPPHLYLWGDATSGKTHLLQAACRSVQAHGFVPLYVPFTESELMPDVLEEAEHAFLICLDDVQRIAGDRAWEAALFALYERTRATGARLVVAANAAPAQLGLSLPDLSTRLGWGPVYQLQPLTDEGKLEALRLHALAQGIELAPEVTRYILNRYPRDLHSLFQLLERIDRAALASKRRVTIPLIQALEQTREPR